MKCTFNLYWCQVRYHQTTGKSAEGERGSKRNRKNEREIKNDNEGGIKREREIEEDREIEEEREREREREWGRGQSDKDMVITVTIWRIIMFMIKFH